MSSNERKIVWPPSPEHIVVTTADIACRVCKWVESNVNFSGYLALSQYVGTCNCCHAPYSYVYRVISYQYDPFLDNITLYAFR